MKFFIDTADINEIRDLAATGLVDGVTTNPSLVAKSGRNFLEVVKEICAVVPGPVSAEVTATDHAKTMLAEGRKLAKLAQNVVRQGAADAGRAQDLQGAPRRRHQWSTSRSASRPRRRCSPPRRAPTFISPFVGRLDDIGTDGMALIADIVQIYNAYPATSRPRCWSPRCAIRSM